MPRLGETDLSDRLAPAIPALVTQLGFGAACAVAAVLVRALVDGVAPAAGPFALGYPAVLIATLFGRWTAGLVALSISLLYSWYFVLPVAGSFELANPEEWPRVPVNAAAYALTLVVAERFRRAVRRAAAERDREIAERDLYLREFEHRVTNNFALVASLLDLQQLRAAGAEAREALTAARDRVESVARAHRHLYRGGSHATVDMAAYLPELCAALGDALFLRVAITLTCETVPAAMPRDRAVPIGLVVNELVTNAAKHAFRGRDAGEIRVVFAEVPGGWRLTVADDGVGMPPEALAKGRKGGLGHRLVEAFARQAGGTLSAESDASGTRHRLDVPAE